MMEAPVRSVGSKRPSTEAESKPGRADIARRKSEQCVGAKEVTVEHASGRDAEIGERIALGRSHDELDGCLACRDHALARFERDEPASAHVDDALSEHRRRVVLRYLGAELRVHLDETHAAALAHRVHLVTPNVELET